MGLFVEVEGGDGTGKTTLVKSLKHYYESLGRPVLAVSFPLYDGSELDSVIQGYLYKRWTTGDRHRDAFIHQCCHVLQRMSTVSRRDPLGEAWLLFSDRYALSSFVYSRLDGLDVDWFRRVQSCLRRPDLLLYLSAPPEERLRRVAARSGPGSIYESDGERGDAARDRFHTVSRLYDEEFERVANTRKVKIDSLLPQEEVLSLAVQAIGSTEAEREGWA